MKIRLAIPNHNHNKPLEKLLEKLGEKYDVLVVDDGSDTPFECSFSNVKILRFKKNRGKSAALNAAFEDSTKLGYTHVLAMDADGQHPPEFIDEFFKAAELAPCNIVVGARDFENSAIPAGRKFLNKFSNFWFRLETGVDCKDTQCGYRLYPLCEVAKLKISCTGFAYEVELLVKACWAGAGLSHVAIPAVYGAETLCASHYRPFADTLKFSLMNTRLFFESVFLSRRTLRKLALKK